MHYKIDDHLWQKGKVLPKGVFKYQLINCRSPDRVIKITFFIMLFNLLTNEKTLKRTF